MHLTLGPYPLASRDALAKLIEVSTDGTRAWHRFETRSSSICNAIFIEKWLYANAAYFMTRSGHRGLPFHAQRDQVCDGIALR